MKSCLLTVGTVLLLTVSSSANDPANPTATKEQENVERPVARQFDGFDDPRDLLFDKAPQKERDAAPPNEIREDLPERNTETPVFEADQQRSKIDRRAEGREDAERRLQRERSWPDRPKAVQAEGREDAEHRLQQLREEIKDLERQHSQRHRPEREHREREHREREHREREHRERDQSPVDAVRRLEHLRAASEHLHQAGLHELAEQVSREAMEVEHQLHASRRNVPHPESMDKLMQQLQEVRRELQQLREEVQDLRHRSSR